MELAKYIVLGLASVFIVANMLYPGGWVLTLLVVIALLLFLAAYEFLPEYILVTNQGKNARKDKRRKRRSRGLNPFSRTSKREGNGRQQRTQNNDGGRNE